jgi:cell wall hydrolase
VGSSPSRVLLPGLVLSLRLSLLGATIALVLATSTAASGFTVHYGSRGSPVLRVQRRLAALGYLDRHGVDGLFGDETWHAVVAFQGWERIRRDGIVGPVTLSVLRHAKPPRPWVRLQHALEVDLNRQVLLLVSGGVVERALHASTAAPPYATPRGDFVIIRRERRSWSYPYHLWLPYALYFYRGWAIHGFPVVPDQPVSHGCIRVSTQDARLLFEHARLGTRVIIRGRPSPALIAPSERALASGQRTR